MTDRAADIAQEVAANFGASLNAEAMADLVECIAAALRSYAEERLEEWRQTTAENDVPDGA